MTRVLYIDDEKSLLTLTQLYLKEEADLDVEIATSAEEGLDLLKNSVYDAIISDYDMPDLDGIDFLKLVRAYDLTIPFIIFTGKGREEVAIEALNNGADFYIQKGGDPRTIFTELANAVRHLVRRTQAERHALQIEQHLVAFLNALPDIAYIKGPDLRYLLINTAYQKYLGLSSVQDAVGKTDDDLLPPSLAHLSQKSDETILDKKEPVFLQSNFNEKVYQIQKFPLSFPSGTTGIGGIIREIPEN